MRLKANTTQLNDDPIHLPVQKSIVSSTSFYPSQGWALPYSAKVEVGIKLSNCEAQ